MAGFSVEAMTSGSPWRTTSNLLIFRTIGPPAANGSVTRPQVTAVAADPVVNWGRNGGAQIQIDGRVWLPTSGLLGQLYYLMRCGTVVGTQPFDGGEGFTGTPVVTSNDTGTGGSGCTYGTPTMATGATSYTVTPAASNYPQPPAVTITDLSGSGSGGTGHLVVNNSIVTGFVLDSVGSNYVNPQAVATGTGSNIVLSVGQSGGQLTNPQVVSPGSGCNNPPTVTVTAPSGTGGATGNIQAKALAVIYDSNAGALAGQVRQVVPFAAGLPGCGSGYTGTSVTCTIAASPNGSTPTVTGNVSMYVASVPVASAGDNYNSTPQIVFTGGSPTRPASYRPFMSGVTSSDTLTFTAPSGWMSSQPGATKSTITPAAAYTTTPVANNAWKREVNSWMSAPPTMIAGVNVGSQPLAPGSPSFIHKNLAQCGQWRVGTGTGIVFYNSADNTTPATWTNPTSTILNSVVYNPSLSNQVDSMGDPVYMGQFSLVKVDPNANTTTEQPMWLGTSRTSGVSCVPVPLSGDVTPLVVPSGNITITGGGVASVSLSGMTFANTYQGAAIVAAHGTGSGFAGTVQVVAGTPTSVTIHFPGTSWSPTNKPVLTIYGTAVSGTKVSSAWEFSYVSGNTSLAPGVEILTANSTGTWNLGTNYAVVAPLSNGEANPTFDFTKPFAIDDDLLAFLAPSQGKIELRGMDRTQGFAGVSNLIFASDLLDATSDKPWKLAGQRFHTTYFKTARYFNNDPSSSTYSWSSTRVQGPQSCFTGTDSTLTYSLAGNTVSGSPVVSGISDTANVRMAGALVSGSGVPANSYIAFFGQEIHGTFTQTSKVVKGINDTSRLSPGMDVSAVLTTLPFGTTIQSVDSSSQITLTNAALANGPTKFVAGTASTFTLGGPAGIANATATATGVPLAFTNPGFIPLPPTGQQGFANNNSGSNKAVVAELVSATPHGLATGQNVALFGDATFPVTNLTNSNQPASVASNTTSGTLSVGSATITGMSDAQLYQVNEPIYGAGVAAGALVKSVDSPSQITMTAPATGSGTQTLTILGVAPGASSIVGVGVMIWVTSPTSIVVNFGICNDGGIPSNLPGGAQAVNSSQQLSLISTAFPNGWPCTVFTPSATQNEPYECLAYACAQVPGSALRVNFPTAYTDPLISLIATRVASQIGPTNIVDLEYSNEDWNGTQPFVVWLHGLTKLLSCIPSGAVMNYVSAPTGAMTGYAQAHTLLGGYGQDLFAIAFVAAGGSSGQLRRCQGVQYSFAGNTTVPILQFAAQWRIPVDRTLGGPYLNMPNDWPVVAALSPLGANVTGAGGWPMDAINDMYRWTIANQQNNWGSFAGHRTAALTYATATGFPPPLSASYEGGPQGAIPKVVPLDIQLTADLCFHPSARDVSYAWYALCQQGDPATTGSGYSETSMFSWFSNPNAQTTWLWAYSPSQPAGSGASNQMVTYQGVLGPADMHSHAQSNQAPLSQGWADWFTQVVPSNAAYRGWFPQVLRRKPTVRR